MFIRSKVVRGRTYYQVVEGVREGGKVRQHILAALGTRETVPEAIAEARKKLQARRRSLKSLQRLPNSSAHIAKKIESGTRAMRPVSSNGTETWNKPSDWLPMSIDMWLCSAQRFLVFSLQTALRARTHTTTRNP